MTGTFRTFRTMRHGTMCALLMSCVLSCGTDESLFELVVPVPADTDVAAVGRITHMAIQFRFGADVTFDFPWSAPEQEVIALSDTASTARLFVFGPSDSREPLNVRVLFCSDSGCGVVTGAARLEHHVRFERVLYEVDEPTRYMLSEASLESAAPAPARIDVAACAVAGCGASQPLACDLDGVHRCEN